MVVIETWRRPYNTVRPHSSLHYLPPLEFKRQHQPTPSRAVLQAGDANARSNDVTMGCLTVVLLVPSHCLNEARFCKSCHPS